MDSGFRRNDQEVQVHVIPAKAGIQTIRRSTVLPDLLRSYENQVVFATSFSTIFGLLGRRSFNLCNRVLSSAEGVATTLSLMVLSLVGIRISSDPELFDLFQQFSGGRAQSGSLHPLLQSPP